jgi:amino acid adenylation domain-containing protein
VRTLRGIFFIGASTPPDSGGEFLIREEIVEKELLEGYSISPLQQRSWNISDGEAKLSMVCRFRVTGALDNEQFMQAVRECVRRHEIFRTRFDRLAEMTLPVQVVLDAADPAVESGSDLVQFKLAHKSAEEHVVTIAASPLVADAITLRNLAFEIGDALDGDQAADDGIMQYPDVAAWLNEFLTSPEAEAGRDFWRRKIGSAGVNDAAPDSCEMRHTICADIPQDAVIWVEKLYDGSAEKFQAFLLTCWLAVLQRFGLQSGAPIAVLFDGRTYGELATAMGPIARFVPASVHVHDESTLSSLVNAVRAELDECQKWLECFDPSLWNVAAGAYEQRRAKAFEYLNIGSSRKGRMHTVQVQDISSSGESFALVARCFRRGAGMQFQVEWDPSLWESELVENLKSAFVTLISNVRTATATEQAVATLPLLDGSERRRILEDFNCTTVDFPSDNLLHHLFSKQAARTPDAIAVESDNEIVTYRQLEMRSNRLARYLRKQGVRPDTLVGICMERSGAMVEALLAVLKAGGAYVPLDPDYPRERLAYMIEDSRAVVLLTQSHLANLEPATPQIFVDEIRNEIEKEEDTDPSVQLWPENPAYVIYTSGSTGKPKGAMITHRAICNHMLWMQQAFPLSEADSVLQKTPFSFDASVWEFYAPLFVGARLVMARPGGHQDPDYLAAALGRHGITTLQLVPSVLKALLEVLEPEKCSSLRRLFCGGEALATELVNRVRSKFPRVELCNLYGPTETTIDATFWTCPPEGAAGNIPIGRPVANTETYVLDSELQPVPCGVAGELYIGGFGLGRGYYRRPDLTAERFIPHPFRIGARLYRTGDLARFRQDGTIDFLGRADHQVKIRGLRIEPGEIQARLAEHPDVSDAAVLALQDGSAEMRLVAYVIADASVVSIDQLRRHLAVHLPEYMIPSAFVFLDAFPLTPNGKLDRNALPAPEGNRQRQGAAFRAPRSAAEELLAGLFTDLLGLDAAGIDDNFFDLGGHSLLATQLVSRIRSAFHIDLPLRAVFESPTIAALAQRVFHSCGSDSSMDVLPIPAADRTHPLPLSFAQQRLWFLDQLIPDSPLYHIPAAVALDGKLDMAALEFALSELVARHESLRTRFVNAGSDPVQIIMPPSPVQLPVHDLSGVEDAQPQLDQLIRDSARMPFDLALGPPVRFSLVRLAAERHVLLLTFHHIAADGWSVNVLIEDLQDFYRSHLEQVAPARPELPIQYADFAVWQREWLQSHGQAQLEYWKDRLVGSLPILDVRTDHPRPPQRSWQGNRIERKLPDTLSMDLAQLSRRNQVTLFMTLLAVWKVLLSRYSSQSDILVGTPIANRTRPEIEGLIGFFVNTLVLRTDLSDDPTFLQLLDRVREVCLGAYAHQDLPFEQVVEAVQPERNNGQHPLFQVMFLLRAEPATPPALPGLAISVVDPGSGVAKFDLTLEFATSGNSLQAAIEYSTELFEASTIERMLDHLANLMHSIASNPGQHLSELNMLSDAERQQLLVDFNATTAEYPADHLIHQLFEEHAAAHPEATALVYEDEVLSYAELNRRANRLAHLLLSMGITPGDRVAISVERSLAMVVGLLGVLKAGGAYVPLDPSYPADRLAHMLNDSAPVALLTQTALAPGLPKNIPVVLLDGEISGMGHQPETNPDPHALGLTPEHVAYVIYTSGSTGLPKGVMNRHGGVCNLATAQRSVFNVQAGSRVLQFASFSFDSSVWEMLALCNGAALCLGPRESLLPGEPLLRTLRRHGVTHVTLPSSALAAFGDNVEFGSMSMVLAGEALPPALARRWADRLRLFNGYGPTETTVCATMYRCTSNEQGSVPIGGPIANTKIYILDTHRQPVPVGVAGEIYIGGVGVARGYLNRPELTAERFIADPYSANPDARLYKTGDLGCWLPDGNIEYLGRNDHQVKIRGFRVELGEIETRLAACDGVREAVVIAREDIPGDKRLVAYVVFHEGAEVEPGVLRAQLSVALPEYMMPGAFVSLPALPLTPNGKVDRRALPAPDSSSLVTRPYEAPRNTLEKVLSGIWSELLGVNTVGIHDNFFELGGHSLLATQVVSRIRETFQMELPLRVLFETPTVAGLADAMRSMCDADALEQTAEIIQQVAGLSEDDAANLLNAG